MKQWKISVAPLLIIELWENSKLHKSSKSCMNLEFYVFQKLNLLSIPPNITKRKTDKNNIWSALVGIKEALNSQLISGRNQIFLHPIKLDNKNLISWFFLLFHHKKRKNRKSIKKKDTKKVTEKLKRKINSLNSTTKKKY